MTRRRRAESTATVLVRSDLLRLRWLDFSLIPVGSSWYKWNPSAGWLDGILLRCLECGAKF